MNSSEYSAVNLVILLHNYSIISFANFLHKFFGLFLINKKVLDCHRIRTKQ